MRKRQRSSEVSEMSFFKFNTDIPLPESITVPPRPPPAVSKGHLQPLSPDTWSHPFRGQQWGQVWLEVIEVFHFWGGGGGVVVGIEFFPPPLRSWRGLRYRLVYGMLSPHVNTKSRAHKQKHDIGPEGLVLWSASESKNVDPSTRWRGFLSHEIWCDARPFMLLSVFCFCTEFVAWNVWNKVQLHHVCLEE